MGLSEAFYNFWEGYIDFRGKSSRSEYWWDILMFLIIAPQIIDLGKGFLFPMTTGLLGSTFSTLFFEVIHIIYDLVMIIPMYSLLCRRYHDAGFASKWINGAVGVSMVIFIISLVLLAGKMSFSFWFAIVDLIVIIGNTAVGIMPKNYHQAK